MSKPHRYWIESQRDLAAYLRRVGHLHLHWVRRGGDRHNCSWVLIYEDHTPLCADEARCVRIPVTFR